MKQTIFIFLSLFLLTKTTLIHAQSNEVKFLIDTTISIMKNNSVNANTVNWDTLRHNALIQAKNIYNPFERMPLSNPPPPKNFLIRLPAFSSFEEVTQRGFLHHNQAYVPIHL